MRRQAFTLVELLVVIAILALLASMMLFALAGAEGTAKEMRTRATITKLHNIVMQKYDDFRTRRVPVRAFQKELFTDNNGNGIYDAGDTMQDQNGNGNYDQYSNVSIAYYRLSALRELMRLELPDRMTDLQDAPVTASVIGNPTDKMPPPSKWINYRRGIPAGLTNDAYQGAECLYLIVSKGSDDPDIMEQFSASEQGDKDGDGLMEFWDGWQNPISFLRWAPGYVSALQRAPPAPNEPARDHDSFDPRKTHRPAVGDPFYPDQVHPVLYPLIYSAGPDGEYGLITDSKPIVIRYAYPPSYTPAIPPNNPYFYDGTDRVGTVSGDEATDNITNHD